MIIPSQKEISSVETLYLASENDEEKEEENNGTQGDIPSSEAVEPSDEEIIRVVQNSTKTVNDFKAIVIELIKKYPVISAEVEKLINN